MVRAVHESWTSGLNSIDWGSKQTTRLASRNPRLVGGVADTWAVPETGSRRLSWKSIRQWAARVPLWLHGSVAESGQGPWSTPWGSGLSGAGVPCLAPLDQSGATTEGSCWLRRC